MTKHHSDKITLYVSLSKDKEHFKCSFKVDDIKYSTVFRRSLFLTYDQAIVEAKKYLEAYMKKLDNKLEYNVFVV